jgi:hypothetical protein
MIENLPIDRIFFFYYHIIVVLGGTLWHLPKFLQCILVKSTPSIILFIPPSPWNFPFDIHQPWVRETADNGATVRDVQINCYKKKRKNFLQGICCK